MVSIARLVCFTAVLPSLAAALNIRLANRDEMYEVSGMITENMSARGQHKVYNMDKPNNNSNNARKPRSREMFCIADCLILSTSPMTNCVALAVEDVSNTATSRRSKVEKTMARNEVMKRSINTELCRTK